MGTYAQGGAVHPTQHRTSLRTTYYQWHRVVGQVVHWVCCVGHAMERKVSVYLCLPMFLVFDQEIGLNHEQ